MCWNGQASLALAAVGIGGTIYSAVRKDPIVLWAPLGYFSLMELLQAFTYSVINQCALPSNQIATLLGYLHIAFQPFFINAVAMYFIPDATRIRIQPVIYILCFFSTLFMLIQLYPFEWAGHCDPRMPLCALRLCSVSGIWHIAWEVPTNGLTNSFVNPFTHGFPSYVLMAFVVPILYGSWRFTVFHWIVGPWLAAQTTGNMNEWPAVWCLLSIGLLLIAVKSPLRRYLHVRKWILWPQHWLRGASNRPDNSQAVRQTSFSTVRSSSSPP